jgi:uncharacterized membrane protein
VTLAITTLEISVFLHVAAVVVGFGTTFAEAIALPVAMKLDPRHLPYVYALQLAINRWFVGPAMVIILVTGFYQVSEGGFSLGDPWISATLAIVIVLGGINGAYFIPTDRKLMAMVTAEIAAAGAGPVTLSEDFQRRSRNEGIVGTMVGILILVAIFLMIVKPGA